MKWSVVIGVVSVGLIGGLLAAVALSTTLSQPPSVSTAPAELQRVPPEPRVVREPARPVVPQAPVLVERPEGENGPVDLGEIFDGPSGSVAELQPRYDAAMSAEIHVDDLPSDASEADIEKALTQRTFDATARVNAAAEAHLSYAESAPRAEADEARGKAAQLYEHLAEVLVDAPVPDHFPADQADIQRRTSQHMSRTYARKAAALRARGAR